MMSFPLILTTIFFFASQVCISKSETIHFGNSNGNFLKGTLPKILLSPGKMNLSPSMIAEIRKIENNLHRLEKRIHDLESSFVFENTEPKNDNLLYLTQGKKISSGEYEDPMASGVQKRIHKENVDEMESRKPYTKTKTKTRLTDERIGSHKKVTLHGPASCDKKETFYGPVANDQKLTVHVPWLSHKKFTLHGPVGDDQKEAFHGPVVNDRKLTVHGPVVNDGKLTVHGPVVDDKKLTLHGPIVINEKKVTCHGPVVNDKKVSLHGPVINDKKSRFHGPIVDEKIAFNVPNSDCDKKLVTHGPDFVNEKVAFNGPYFDNNKVPFYGHSHHNLAHHHGGYQRHSFNHNQIHHGVNKGLRNCANCLKKKANNLNHHVPHLKLKIHESHGKENCTKIF